MKGLSKFEDDKKNYHRKAALQGNADDRYSDNLQQIPNFVLHSNIINFKQYCKLWEKFSSSVRIRNPEKVYETALDGYNLGSMYGAVHEFIENEGGYMIESYHYCLMLI